MFDSSTSTPNWGIVIFFLILFWVFMGNNGCGGFGGFGWGRNACAGPWMGQNEVTPFDNNRALSAIQCSLEKDTAVLQGQLETAFRQTINNDNINTAAILSGQKDLYIKQLERENTNLFVTAQNEQTRQQALLLKADTDAKLESIRCQMAKQPPVYTASCIPCGIQPNFGCGFGNM